ncbi:hypothetical protein Pcinc_004009 [Petrolisthes cinctipes]|uniref:Uncharacterized protein n=1 Tax=Petrolisthes cinctipes TaxID=88211 RepID=A0AAE1GHL1_PETCI|nr:hypothetical protein Pcinc_004009 [Petrolisthes cinctipes]
MGGGPEVKLLLKPSEEALLNLGLLEREAIEGLSDFPDSENPDLSVIGTTLYGKRRRYRMRQRSCFRV